MYPYAARIKNQQVMIAESTWQLRLFTAPTTLNNGRVFADFTEPTFPGYAPITVTWTAPVLDGSNNSLAEFDAPYTFTQSSSASPQTVYGALLTYDLTGGAFLAYDFKLFPTALVFASTGNLVTITNWPWRVGLLAP